MKIAISIDSACDMPKELKERYNIFTMPYYVTLGDKEYIDGVNVTTDDLFAYVKQTGNLPKTAAISSSQFRTYFKDILKNYDEIIHITLSHQMTSSGVNAIAGAEEKYLQEGFADYISKPIEYQILEEKLSKHLKV